jgi:hypothetical protein
MNLIAGILAVSFAATTPASAAQLPNDVRKFLERRETCDHFRGEFDSHLTEREVRQLNTQLKRWCTGTDKALKHLKKKYAANPSVLTKLADLDEDIEPR